MKEVMQAVSLQRSIENIEVITDTRNDIHVNLKLQAMKDEMVKQLTGFYILHGIRTLRRTELHELASKAHGLLKNDGRWHIHSVEKPIDELVEEGVIERIQYTEPKKATYIRLTSAYINKHLKHK
jgi:hypothetical protein